MIEEQDYHQLNSEAESGFGGMNPSVDISGRVSTEPR
jgi:hypothetical protein